MVWVYFWNCFHAKTPRRKGAEAERKEIFLNRGILGIREKEGGKILTTDGTDFTDRKPDRFPRLVFNMHFSVCMALPNHWAEKS